MSELFLSLNLSMAWVSTYLCCLMILLGALILEHKGHHVLSIKILHVVVAVGVVLVVVAMRRAISSS